MSVKFRVGVDPGWGGRLDALLGPALRELFAPGGRIEWEVMPEPPGGVALPQDLRRYDGVLAMQMNFPAASFAGAERLVCIARWGVGFDRIDDAAATEADVLIALTPTAISHAVGEAEIALIFALAKQLPALDRRTREGRWRTDLPITGVDVAGKTLAPPSAWARSPRRCSAWRAASVSDACLPATRTVRRSAPPRWASS